MRKSMIQPGKSVKVIPLGGLEQIGMNITAFETRSNFRLTRSTSTPLRWQRGSRQ